MAATNKIRKQIFKYIYYLPVIQHWIDTQRYARELMEWKEKPHSVMLPHVLKQEVLKDYALKYQLSNLVETGTYLGEMIYALKDVFKKIYSIELSKEYAKRAKVFLRKQKHVKILEGDSGEVIGELLKEIDQPTLFWLDGHYSADNTAMGKKHTPVLEELDHILRAKDLRHVILIDDARDFGLAKDYPSLDELTTFVLKFRENIEIISKDDIIRILPK